MQSPFPWSKLLPAFFLFLSILPLYPDQPNALLEQLPSNLRFPLFDPVSGEKVLSVQCPQIETHALQWGSLEIGPPQPSIPEVELEIWLAKLTLPFGQWLSSFWNEHHQNFLSSSTRLNLKLHWPDGSVSSSQGWSLTSFAPGITLNQKPSSNRVNALNLTLVWAGNNGFCYFVSGKVVDLATFQQAHHQWTQHPPSSKPGPRR